MNKLYIKKTVMLTVPKKQLYLVLPFMGKMSELDHYINVYLFLRLKNFLTPLIFEKLF